MVYFEEVWYLPEHPHPLYSPVYQLFMQVPILPVPQLCRGILHEAEI